MASGVSSPGPSSAQARPLLVVRDLHKSFRKTVAVDGLSFDVRPGELLGFIGPNGAGKSTTVKAITGQLLADSGTIEVDGHDILAEPMMARRLTGYVPQDLALYPFLTGRELLEFVADVRDIDRAAAGPAIDELLERFNLSDAQHRMTREYSEGMARKLAISAALIGDPPLLVLDESLNGLDPRAAAEVKSVVRSRLEEGAAVLLVSHVLDVLERLCSSVVLIDRGRVVKHLDRAALDQLAADGTTLESFFIAHTVGESSPG